LKVNTETTNNQETPVPSKKRKINTWGIYISLCFIVVGLVWYGVNIGLIPVSFVQEQAGPIIVVILGLLILIKSVNR
jgi:hypothetical protein